MQSNSFGLDSLRAALVADILDSLGLRDQALAADIVPLRPNGVLVGPAFPARSVEVDRIPDVAYDGLLRALDTVGQGEIFVLATNRTSRSAMWGELLSTACSARGVKGVVTDGYARDTDQIVALGFPTYCRGSIPLDIHGRSEIVEFGQPVTIDGVVIAALDTVVADSDGVVIVPAEIAVEVMARAHQKGQDEGEFRDAVRKGMPASEAYHRFKVL